MNSSNYHDELEKNKKRNLIVVGVVGALALAAVLVGVSTLINKSREPKPFITEEEPVTPEVSENTGPTEAELAAQKAKEEEARAEAEAKAKAEAQAKAKAEAAAKARAEADAKARAEAKAKENSAAAKEAKAKKEAAAKAAAEAKAKKAAEDKAQAEAAAKAKAEAQAKAKAAEEAKAKKLAEEKAKKEAAAKAAEEAKAKKAAEEKAKAEAAAKAKLEAEAKAKAEAEAKAKAEAEAKAKAEKEAAAQKAFQAEDLKEPDKVEVSQDAKLAMVDKVEPSIEGENLASSTSDFQLGMNAYQGGNFKNAVTAFNKVPVPSTKQRGAKDREEYVNANFFKGLSLQKLGSLKEAVSAYQNVLKYEKYFPVCQMNLGICYVELRQFGKADKAFKNVVRDHTRIPPAQYDDVMQRTRYFWAIAWTRLYKAATNPDKKAYFKNQATLRWNDYQAWYGSNSKYAKANEQAKNYINSLNGR